MQNTANHAFHGVHDTISEIRLLRKPRYRSETIGRHRPLYRQSAKIHSPQAFFPRVEHRSGHRK